MTEEEKAEKIANERCRELMCYGRCNIHKNHHCGYWHYNYECALKGIEYVLAEGRKETAEKISEVEKENAKLKAENKQIIERERVGPEHYLCEMIEKCKELKKIINKYENETVIATIIEDDMEIKELKAQIEEMKCCETEIQVKAMNRFLENLKMISPDVYEKYINTDFVELRKCKNKLNQSKG